MVKIFLSILVFMVIALGVLNFIRWCSEEYKALDEKTQNFVMKRVGLVLGACSAGIVALITVVYLF
jgi:hypothetical protein